jgi:uncharacterized protein (DUF433 family)
MTATLEVLTPTEAAIVSGVSVRDINRIIDEKILPEGFYSTSVPRMRFFKSNACVFIAFYFESAEQLTSEERLRTIAMASRLFLKWKAKQDWSVQDEFLTIDLFPFWERVQDRLLRLSAARDLVTVNEDILGGTPVIRGTRIPVYEVAASAAAGLPMRRILSAYPGLDEEKVGLAALYAEANPQRGRPRRTPAPPTGAVIVSSRRLPRRDTVR